MVRGCRPAFRMRAAEHDKISGSVHTSFQPPTSEKRGVANPKVGLRDDGTIHRSVAGERLHGLPRVDSYPPGFRFQNHPDWLFLVTFRDPALENGHPLNLRKRAWEVFGNQLRSRFFHPSTMSSKLRSSDDFPITSLADPVQWVSLLPPNDICRHGLPNLSFAPELGHLARSLSIAGRYLVDRVPS
jgi:hypothetical protein